MRNQPKLDLIKSNVKRGTLRWPKEPVGVWKDLSSQAAMRDHVMECNISLNDSLHLVLKPKPEPITRFNRLTNWILRGW